MTQIDKGLSDIVYNHILNLIFTKRLTPGEHIPETKIAQTFNISRSPVRDAMRQLSNEGIIDIFPKRFAQVKVYTKDHIIEIGTLRVALDSLSVKLASLYGSRSDFLKLLEICEQLETAYRENDLILQHRLDCDFHLQLSVISKNDLLIKYQKELYQRVQYILTFYPNPIIDEKSHIEQHRQITQALIMGDEHAATSIIIEHISSFYSLGDKFPPSFFGMS